MTMDTVIYNDVWRHEEFALNRGKRFWKLFIDIQKDKRSMIYSHRVHNSTTKWQILLETSGSNVMHERA